MKDEIRCKLRAGQSIESVCQEYDLSFKELVGLFHNMVSRGVARKNRKTGNLYITKTSNGRFTLNKNNVHYGTHRRLSDAKKVRDYFIYNRWDKRKIDEVCEKVGVKRIKGRGR